MSMKSVNPATGQVLREYETLGEAELEGRLELAIETQPRFAGFPIGQRAEWLTAAADRLRDRRATFSIAGTAE